MAIAQSFFENNIDFSEHKKTNIYLMAASTYAFVLFGNVNGFPSLGFHLLLSIDVIKHASIDTA